MKDTFIVVVALIIQFYLIVGNSHTKDIRNELIKQTQIQRDHQEQFKKLVDFITQE